MPGGRKSKSFKQATDMSVDGAYQDLVVPNRAKGDPTGQSTALGNQIDAVEPQTQSPILAGASTMPMVAVKNIMMAFDPSLLIAGISILRHSKTKLAGSKYLEAIKYRLDSSEEMIPNEFNPAGIK